MKLINIRRFDDEFYSLAEAIQDGMTAALRRHEHGDVVKEYEDTIKSIAFAATEELIERVAEVEHRVAKQA